MADLQMKLSPGRSTLPNRRVVMPGSRCSCAKYRPGFVQGTDAIFTSAQEPGSGQNMRLCRRASRCAGRARHCRYRQKHPRDRADRLSLSRASIQGRHRRRSCPPDAHHAPAPKLDKDLARKKTARRRMVGRKHRRPQEKGPGVPSRPFHCPTRDYATEPSSSSSRSRLVSSSWIMIAV